MSQDTGMPVQGLTDNTLSSIAANEAAINSAASAAGVSALSIAEPIAREENKADVGDYSATNLGGVGQGIKNFLAQYGVEGFFSSAGSEPLTALSNQDYVNSLNSVVSGNVSNTISNGLQSNINRIIYPTLNDIGPAKIQIGTAMQAVAYYANNPGRFAGTDPLNLLQYVNNTPKLVNDLLNPENALQTSISIEAVIAQQAEDWAATRVSNWSSYSLADQAAFVAAFSAQGQASFDQKYSQYLAIWGVPGAYTPDLANGDGSAYFSGDATGTNNASELQNILGNPSGANGGDSSDPALIAPGTYSNVGQLDNPNQITSTSFADGTSIAAVPNTDGGAGVSSIALTSSGVPSFVDSQQTNADGTNTIAISNETGSALLTSNIDATQVGKTNGVFVIGSSQPDSDGYTNQLSLAATSTFGIANLNVTDPATGQTTSVPLTNGSGTTLQEGHSVATGAPNELASETQPNGPTVDTAFGQGATVTDANANVDVVTPGGSVNLAASGDSLNGTGATFAMAGGVTGASYVMAGFNNTLDLNANSGSFATVFSTGMQVNGDSGPNGVNLGGVGTSATVDGGGSVGLNASNEAVTLGDAGSTVNLAANVQGENVIGSGATLDADGVIYGNIIGNNDTLNRLRSTRKTSPKRRRSGRCARSERRSTARCSSWRSTRSVAS